MPPVHVAPVPRAPCDLCCHRALCGTSGLICEAFAAYASDGVAEVVCEEKHMGSRAVVIVCQEGYASSLAAVSLQGNIRPGEYTIAVQLKDAIGAQTVESKYTFTVE